jgi:hypothetical protein
MGIRYETRNPERKNGFHSQIPAKTKIEDASDLPQTFSEVLAFCSQDFRPDVKLDVVTTINPGEKRIS